MFLHMHYLVQSQEPDSPASTGLACWVILHSMQQVFQGQEILPGLGDARTRTVLAPRSLVPEDSRAGPWAPNRHQGSLLGPGRAHMMPRLEIKTPIVSHFALCSVSGLRQVTLPLWASLPPNVKK
jgi:hypothetical protein